VKPIVVTTYTFTGTNTTTGCENSASVIIGLNPLPTIDAGIDTSMCIGDSLQLLASGGSTYLWDFESSLSSIIVPDPWTNSTADITYYLDAWDANGCFGEDSVEVIVNPLPSAPVILEIDEWLISSYVTGNQWYFDGNPVVAGINDSLDWVAEGLNGSYTLLYTDANGCSKFSEVTNIIVIDDIGFDENNAFNVKLYPNPTQGVMNIELMESVDMLFVLNANGQVLVNMKNLNAGITAMDLSDLPDGMYIVQLVKDDSIVNKRIVKQ